MENKKITKQQRNALGQAMFLEEALNLGFASVDVRTSKNHNGNAFICHKSYKPGQYDLNGLDDEFDTLKNPTLQIFVRFDREVSDDMEGGFFATAYTIGTSDNFNDGAINAQCVDEFGTLVMSNGEGDSIVLYYETSAINDYAEAFKSLWKLPKFEKVSFRQSLEDFKAWLRLSYVLRG